MPTTTLSLWTIPSFTHPHGLHFRRRAAGTLPRLLAISCPRHDCQNHLPVSSSVVAFFFLLLPFCIQATPLHVYPSHQFAATCHLLLLGPPTFHILPCTCLAPCHTTSHWEALGCTYHLTWPLGCSSALFLPTPYHTPHYLLPHYFYLLFLSPQDIYHRAPRLRACHLRDRAFSPLGNTGAGLRWYQSAACLLRQLVAEN